MSLSGDLFLGIAIGALAFLLIQAVLRSRGAPVVILELLSDGREWYGLELVKASGGRLRRGTVYVHLGRLEEAGKVISRPTDVAHGFQRRVYRQAIWR